MCIDGSKLLEIADFLGSLLEDSLKTFFFNINYLRTLINVNTPFSGRQYVCLLFMDGFCLFMFKPYVIFVCLCLDPG